MTGRRARLVRRLATQLPVNHSQAPGVSVLREALRRHMRWTR